VRYPSTPAAVAGAVPRSYSFDGPIGAYQNTATNEVMLFPGMRRGGRAVYGFSVTNPDQPRLMWSINNTMTDYASLGQTWSMPRVSRIKGSVDPVLIMGGGYDPASEDANPAAATTLGRGVYVINIRTGARLGWIPTEYSVPADVSIIDSDGDGYVDRAYLVDARAQLYRLDIEAADGAARAPADWRITKIAAMNDGAGGTTGTRKVFFAPDVVLTRNYSAILFGTGDREKPLTGTTNDRFFLVKDTRVAKGEPTSVSLITEASLTMIGSEGATTDEQGCAYALATNGEKVINQPITFGGITYFSTNRPLPAGGGSCARSQSRAYQLPLVCQAPTYRNLVGDGLPPSPVVGYVDVGGGKLVPFVIGGGGETNSSIEGERARIVIPAKRKRSFWFMENRDR